MDFCVKSLVNAKQFLVDAQLLYKNKSYGHAYSLSVLGFEELAKIWTGYYLLLGIHNEKDAEIDDLFFDHVLKQRINWKTIKALLDTILFEQILKTEYRVKLLEKTKGVTNIEVFNNHLWELIQEMSEDKKNMEIANIATNQLELKKILQRYNEDKYFMNKRKNDGFYVGFNSDARKVKSPQDFTLDDTKFIDFFQWFCDYTESSLTVFREKIHDSGLKEAIQMLNEIELDPDRFRNVMDKILKIFQVI